STQRWRAGRGRAETWTREKGRSMPTVSVNGVELHYVKAGDGEPLLLIMGFGGDHLAWAVQVPAFSASYRVIRLDNRGAGRSSVPDAPYTTRLMAADAVG